MPRWLRPVVVLVAVVVAGLGGLRLWAASAAPAPGVGAGQVTPCPATPNCVSSLDTDEVHGTEPLACALDDVGARRDALVDALEQLPRTEVVEADEHYLHAVSRTLLVGFRDDVELAPDDGTVQVRSASRLGSSDLGVNRDRVERLRGLVAAACGSGG